MRTIVNVNPLSEMRAMEEAVERIFNANWNARPATPTFPVDILERDNLLIIRASVPGISPENLEVTVENNVLTIRGESRAENETGSEKVYRREIAYGTFTRSVRLPENVDVHHISASFKHGVVEISIPRIVEEPPKALKIAVKNLEQGAETTSN